MNTKALKQKILNLAIHGKLLPLDKVEKIRKEEPASILLEKIRVEKEEKIAKGELKKDKKDSFIFLGDDKRHYEKFTDGSVKDIEDEIPFDIPDGWSWVRIPEISNIIFAGGDKPEIYEKEITESCNIPIFSNGIEKDGLYGYTNKAVVDKPCITISARGTIGYTCIRNESFVPIVRLITIIPNEIINLVYIKNVFDSLLVVGEGSSIPQLTVPTVKQVLFPLPPLAEQQLIVSEIEKIFAQIDLLEQNKTDLQTAIKQAKSKILNLAIHGKLVSQDPNDEPASILLEKIRAEKQEKIAKGELKKDKKDSFIFLGDDKNHYEKFADGSVKNIDDEIPFDIPDGWSWCRLKDISDIFTGNSINENEKITKYSNIQDGYFYIATKDINFDRKINYDNGIKIPFNETKFKIAPTNSILLCIEGGSAGRKIGLTNRDVCFVNKLCCLHSNTINNSFIYFYIQSSTFIDLFNESKSGLIGGVSLNNIKEFFFPLPPLSEQQRIVSKIEEIFAILDRISSELGADI